jgi:ABC-type nitrate/sulfonate/bicarbonate transport system substrate-binding protein
VEEGLIMSVSPHATRKQPALRLPLAAAAAAAVLALTACGGGTEASAPAASEGKPDYGQLDMNLSWIKNAEFAGEYFADSKGYFADAGFSKVNLIAGGPSGTSSETMVLSGGALVGTSSPLGVAPVIQEDDAPLKIIGTKYQKNPFTVVSLADDPIETPQDLVGKKIGVQAGVNETLFEALLEVNDIDASSVTIVPVQYDPQPLANGDVDGFFAYITNESLTLELDGHDVVNLPLADNGLPFMAESLVTTEENIETKRDALKGFLAAMIRGWKDAVADPEESARLAVEEYGADLGLEMQKETRQAEEQNALVESADTEANGLLTMSDKLMDDNVEILKLAGYDLTKDQLFDPSLLEEVYAENPDLK